MKATGRTQVASPDGGAVYTLYARQGPNLTHAAPGTVANPSPIHAFVHALDLVRGFAHCVDVPDGFGAGPAAVAVTPDGAALFLIDGGRVVVVDTRHFRTSRAAPIRLAPASSLSAAADGSRDGALFIGAGTQVVVLDQATLRVTKRYSAGGDVTGLALSADERSLYVALDDKVVVIDAATGTEIRTLGVPGLTGILAARAFPGA
jgi:DNA-binding beta-propeller fold protein YncE